MIFDSPVYSSKILPNLDIKIEKPKEILPYKINANSHRGIILSLLSKFNRDVKLGINYTPYELSIIFTEALTKYNEIDKRVKASVKLNRWKGISGIHVLEYPDSFIVRTYQKKDQDSDAIENQRIISKDEINSVIAALNTTNTTNTTNTKINTKDIAKIFCELRNIKKNHEDRDLFNNNLFDWDLFFSDRLLHTQLNLCLRVLDYYGIIKYRGGKSQVLKQIMSIQTEL